MIPRKDDRVNSFFKIIFDAPFGHALSGVRVQKVQRVQRVQRGVVTAGAASKKRARLALWTRPFGREG